MPVKALHCEKNHIFAISEGMFREVTADRMFRAEDFWNMSGHQLCGNASVMKKLVIVSLLPLCVNGCIARCGI